MALAPRSTSLNSASAVDSKASVGQESNQSTLETQQIRRRVSVTEDPTAANTGSFSILLRAVEDGRILGHSLPESVSLRGKNEDDANICQHPSSKQRESLRHDG